ncbi:sensor histidine kinase [Pontibacter qinzhouensis]|uniref:histidine kinase n=1 Tax=Pontibacter qinzhouensis TaxID=2603253 RepID=A0A5C8KCA3_9BACT|nr:ATP-binding protein [Pontibacter qinzhouensis]TXK49111.1 sensor histidine kinase [Pontibacter qinzhouensis]
MSPFIPFIIATSIILLLALGVVVFVVMYQKRLMKHQEYLRQLQETRQRQLLEAALEAQEAERRRVARDLHDEVGTMLALVKLQAGQWSNGFGKGEIAEGQQPVTNLKLKLDEVMNSVRRITHDLMPIVLTKFGLVQAIESLKRSMPVDSNIGIKFECNEPDRRVGQKLELALYRIVQELLGNTLKHAQASEVYIKLTFNTYKLELVYTDNGKGFSSADLTENTTTTGLGLTNLQSRIALLNGTISINSELGAGISVVANVPLLTEF